MKLQAQAGWKQLILTMGRLASNVVHATLRARFSLRWIPGNATNDDGQELRRLQPPTCVVDLRQIATTGEREGKRGEAELETTGRDESRKCQYQVPPSKLREGKVPRRGSLSAIPTKTAKNVKLSFAELSGRSFCSHASYTTQGDEAT